MFEFQFAILPPQPQAVGANPAAQDNLPQLSAPATETFHHLLNSLLQTPAQAPKNQAPTATNSATPLSLIQAFSSQLQFSLNPLQIGTATDTPAAPVSPPDEGTLIASSDQTANLALLLFLAPSLPRLLTRLPEAPRANQSLAHSESTAPTFDTTADAIATPSLTPNPHPAQSGATPLPVPSPDESLSQTMPSGFPNFFPLFPAPQPEGPVLNFASDFGNTTPTPSISYSYVEVRAIEVTLPQPRLILVPLAVTPRPMESWLLALLQSAGFLAELADTEGQSDLLSALPALPSEFLPALEVPAENADAGLPDLNPAASAPTTPHAIPAEPKLGLAAVPAQPANQAQNASVQNRAGAAPHQALQAHEDSLSEALETGPDFSFSDLAKLSPEAFQRMAFNLLALSSEESSVWPEDESYWQHMLAALPLLVRPPLAAGANGQTAETIEAPSGLTISLLALLPALPSLPTESADTGSATVTVAPITVSPAANSSDLSGQQEQPGSQDQPDTAGVVPASSQPVAVTQEPEAAEEQLDAPAPAAVIQVPAQPEASPHSIAPDTEPDLTSPVPVAQAPVAQAPVAQAPVAQAPVAQAPVAQAPAAQAPVAQAPVAQAPVAQAPVAQ
ncbi:MAG: hypothetical protein CVV27_08965, partial [Candidatus Melainabacteria bacterium HGW-Melainabacteria-1]